MPKEFPPQYNPKETEARIYRMWEESGFFAPEAHQPRADNPNSEKSFCITVPPPNVTGSLHMGHALNATIQDIFIRKKRMEGYKTLWLPGTDHAGIATQNVVEKDLKKRGLTRHDLGREKFLESIWEWKEKYGSIILGQFKKLGCSMDWSRTRFTMDEGYRKAVEEAFLRYHEKGLLYKAERVINWCVKDQTALSDLELEYKEEKGKLYFIKYPLSDGTGFITVATTRPETMLGDAAVAVHPEDERWQKFIGKKAVLPIQNREITVIADEEIDHEFGTGAVKVTPAHDLLDARIGEKHGLQAYKIIDPVGKMTAEAGKICEGLKTKECRERVIAELEKQDLLEKTEDYTHNVAVCYRCEGVIEPQPSLQWFLKMEELAKRAIEAAEKGEIKFHPENWKQPYLEWLRNVKDWNVSRQIWWGHKIPIEGETDVLDTWFSSALWPFATLGWPEKTKDLETFYPTQVLSTGRDILNLWVSRMVFSGYEFTGQKPFSDVIIHATVLTKDGKRMSKSLGTGVDPMDLIEKYGADATRFGLIWQHMGTQDVHWAEEHVAAGRKFANKLWNIGRFVVRKIENHKLQITNYKNEPPKAENEASKEILARLAQTEKLVDNEMGGYRLGHALHALYDFVWHDFADGYVEYAKKNDSEEVRATLIFCLDRIIRLLHPFMPFVTEEIWQRFENKIPLIIAEWKVNNE